VKAVAVAKAVVRSAAVMRVMMRVEVERAMGRAMKKTAVEAKAKRVALREAAPRKVPQAARWASAREDSATTVALKAVSVQEALASDIFRSDAVTLALCSRPQ
jgi:hypothetical protein